MKIVLVKKSPDNDTPIIISFSRQEDLREHLEAMWRNTPEYSIVSIYHLPTNNLKRIRR